MRPNDGLYHGTSAEFSAFMECESGLHFGTFDQAAHAATRKLARMDHESFARLRCDDSGWPGRILRVALLVQRVERVRDCKTPQEWAAEINRARIRGVDCLVYVNEFEGREPGDSFVVWDASKVLILCDDVTRTPGSGVVHKGE
jgi:hypothetical protein